MKTKTILRSIILDITSSRLHTHFYFINTNWMMLQYCYDTHGCI